MTEPCLQKAEKLRRAAPGNVYLLFEGCNIIIHTTFVTTLTVSISVLKAEGCVVSSLSNIVY